MEEQSKIKLMELATHIVGSSATIDVERRLSNLYTTMRDLVTETRPPDAYIGAFISYRKPHDLVKTESQVVGIKLPARGDAILQLANGDEMPYVHADYDLYWSKASLNPDTASAK